MKFRLTLLMTGLVMANAASAATQIDLRLQPAAYMQSKLATQTNNSQVKFERIRTDIDFNHTAHTRIQQTYAGIPVWAATGIIHTPDAGNKSRKNALVTIGAPATMNGVVYEGLEKDLAGTSTHALAGAQQKALQTAKNLFTKKTRIVARLKDEKSQHIIFIDENKQAHHAYLTSFTYATPTAVQRPTAIVDAVTQKVYRTWEGILSATPAETRAINESTVRFKKMLHSVGPNEVYPAAIGGIGGNEKIGEIVYEGRQANIPAAKALDVEMSVGAGAVYKFTLCALDNDDIIVIDTAIGGEVVTALCMKNMPAHNNVAWLSVNKGLTRWNDDEMNDGFSPSLDAYYAAAMIRNMYQDWYNVPALIDSDGKPRKFIMRVHFGRKFDNAFWDGEQMTFGDGGSMFYPLTSLGVAAHEISHGFTDTHSNIDYSNPQMGALHESFSDMAAIAVENYATGKNGWDLGREIKKDESALRYLDHPTRDGSSIDHMKDFDATEPHGAAGITNKAFYLLATSKGWNTRKAFDVMLKANMHYWNSSMTTLGEAACGVVAATKDYGYDVTDVRIAFAKVGLDTDQCTAS